MSSEEPGGTAGSSGGILAWEDDPGQPDSPNSPVGHPLPETDRAPFPSRISGEAPAPGAEGTPGFRHWAAADALRRAADFWGGIRGKDAHWNQSVGEVLAVELDAGEDLNAYYDRAGLKFFHGAVGDRVIYSGESPDVACHELGHAVLDSVQPQLWDVHSAEPPALHEAFGDISAMLSALQLPSFRAVVLASTSGRLDRSSRLSRLAEQLGWAIRQSHPQAVDADCLRNASNSFFYRDPLTLPPSAPATALSSEPHSFSRVFTGAFLSALAGMLAAQEATDDAALARVSRDAGELLVEAAQKTPVSVGYFSQFAAHMLAAGGDRFAGRYTGALREGFVRHGVLSLPDATSALTAAAPPPRAPVAAGASPPMPPVRRVPLPGRPYGLDGDLLVHAPVAPKRFDVTAAALDGGSVAEPSPEAAAAGYVEDIFRRGHVAIAEEARSGREVTGRPSRATHEVRRVENGLILVRLLFDCGWGTCEE